jgi:CheY-like chemotaxis protein
VPAELVTDRQRLRQVLHNLLSNAVKFTQQGTVELRIGLAGPRGGGPDDVVAFSVTDTGIGISDDSLKTIFEAFQQGDGTTSRRYGGTGLGLAISREVAAVLGGRITAQSQPGSGSTFTLYLPVVFRGPADGLAATGELASPDRQAAEPVPGLDGETLAPAVPVTEPGAYQQVRGKKVLIVDDDLRNAFAISSVLELYGLSVSHAPGGRQSIEALRADPGIDLVLMDVMMPEMDGYSTTAAIREMAQFADLPVIVVTARAMPGDRDKALAAGASDYVTKPVDTDELLGCITRWLARGSAPD